jgi:hypothetical protein
MKGVNSPGYDFPLSRVISANLEKLGKGLRVPILTAEAHPALMLHRSAIDRYWVNQA